MRPAQRRRGGGPRPVPTSRPKRRGRRGHNHPGRRAGQRIDSYFDESPLGEPVRAPRAGGLPQTHRPGLPVRSDARSASTTSRARPGARASQPPARVPNARHPYTRPTRPPATGPAATPLIERGRRASVPPPRRGATPARVDHRRGMARPLGGSGRARVGREVSPSRCGWPRSARSYADVDGWLAGRAEIKAGRGRHLVRPEQPTSALRSMASSDEPAHGNLAKRPGLPKILSSTPPRCVCESPALAALNVRGRLFRNTSTYLGVALVSGP